MKSKEELDDSVNATVEEDDLLKLGLLQEVTKDKQQYNVGGELYHTHAITKAKEKSEGENLKVKVQIENKLVLIEVDSGACKKKIRYAC